MENFRASFDASCYFLPQLLWPMTSTAIFPRLPWLDQSRGDRKVSFVGSLRWALGGLAQLRKVKEGMPGGGQETRGRKCSCKKGTSGERGKPVRSRNLLRVTEGTPGDAGQGAWL